MCIFVNHNQDHWIDVAPVHTKAVYELIKEKLWDKLPKDEQESLDFQIEFFEAVHLSSFEPDVFNELYRLLMASDDGWITPLQDDFKIAFESDPRFQVA